MPEFISVPTSLWGIRDSIADAALSALVEQEKLPADFEFRALAIDDRLERHRTALQDVRAAFGLGEPSGHPYLTQALPDCISVPVGGTKSRTDILRQIDTDYHQLGTLLRILDDHEVNRYRGYQAWARYIQVLNTEKYASLQRITEPGPQRGSFSKQYAFRSALHDVVIRDSALLPLYEDPTLIPGHGPIKRGFLRLLLQDNHPEIAIPPDD